MCELEAARDKAEDEITRLTQRLGVGDGERKDLELRLESAAQELATTVQLSELALAARVSAAEDERLEKERRLVAEKARLAEQLVGREVLLVLTAAYAASFLVGVRLLKLIAVGCTFFFTLGVGFGPRVGWEMR